jgi:hypothetical protein
MCSGQQRSTLNVDQAAQNAALNLYYSGHVPVHIRGSVTGQIYAFSHLRPVQAVDSRDAVILLASPLFRLTR